MRNTIRCFIILLGLYSIKASAQDLRIPEPSTAQRIGAIALANEGLKLAMAEPNAEYIRMNKEVLTEAQGK